TPRAARWTRRNPPTACAARRRQSVPRRSARLVRRSLATAAGRSSSQVQRVGELQAPLRTFGVHAPRGVGETCESREPPALGLVAVHRELIIVASARVHHVVLAA